MMNKTTEELERALHNARASLSYHKKKNKHNKKKPKGESPRAKANRLAANIVWNDEKKAMAHVVAFLTANAADYKEAFNQALGMPVEDVRELTKGHEDEVEKHIKALQEKRKAKKKAKEPHQLSLALKQAGMFVEHQPEKNFSEKNFSEKNFDDAVTKMLDEAWPDTAAPVKKTVPKTVRELITSTKSNYDDSEETYTAVPVKATTLRLAKEVVSALTGFEGLSNEQVVGHILSRYLQDNA